MRKDHHTLPAPTQTPGSMPAQQLSLQGSCTPTRTTQHYSAAWSVNMCQQLTTPAVPGSACNHKTNDKQHARTPCRARAWHAQAVRPKKRMHKPTSFAGASWRCLPTCTLARVLGDSCGLIRRYIMLNQFGAPCTAQHRTQSAAHVKTSRAATCWFVISSLSSACCRRLLQLTLACLDTRFDHTASTHQHKAASQPLREGVAHLAQRTAANLQTAAGHSLSQQSTCVCMAAGPAHCASLTP